MMVLSSRGRFVPAGGWPIADAERLWDGCEGEGRDLLAPPCWCGLSLPFLRDWDASCAARGVEGLAGVRCEDVRGGGMGAPAVVTAAVAMWGDGCEVEGTDGARGAFRAEPGAAWGELWAWVVVGATIPFREGLLESGDAEGWEA